MTLTRFLLAFLATLSTVTLGLFALIAVLEDLGGVPVKTAIGVVVGLGAAVLTAVWWPCGR